MPLKTNPVSWFEIPVTDLPRAKTFYEQVLGIEIVETKMGEADMGWFPMERGVGGAPGTLIKCQGYTPSHEGTVVYLQVDAIDSTLEAIPQAGGKVLTPRTSIGEHGFIAHFEDCEGNRVALHEAVTQP